MEFLSSICDELTINDYRKECPQFEVVYIFFCMKYFLKYIEFNETHLYYCFCETFVFCGNASQNYRNIS